MQKKLLSYAYIVIFTKLCTQINHVVHVNRHMINILCNRCRHCAKHSLSYSFATILNRTEQIQAHACDLSSTQKFSTQMNLKVVNTCARPNERSMKKQHWQRAFRSSFQCKYCTIFVAHSLCTRFLSLSFAVWKKKHNTIFKSIEILGFNTEKVKSTISSMRLQEYYDNVNAFFNIATID